MTNQLATRIGEEVCETHIIYVKPATVFILGTDKWTGCDKRSDYVDRRQNDIKL